MEEIDPANSTRSPGSEPINPPISTRGVVLGLMILGILLVGFAYWANAAGQRVGSEAAIPTLLVVEPRDGDSTDGPIVVVFEVEADLRRGPGGWTAGRYHVHAMVGERELMPGATDIEGLAPNRYRWAFPPLPAGEHDFHLFWADMLHRTVEAGSSQTVRIQLR